ncbi:STAS domain-containing protein [Marinivivus vitaminiproducens]|uniref:STAS domain-containing protein n=1 Tax=Marinivivus vitaminiproducens TaxID=3035935 RepID=UPI0027A2FA8F|nr:STAS domain-containing protein [Geminicoccaceae bacterium SCSIO 64248]
MLSFEDRDDILLARLETLRLDAALVPEFRTTMTDKIAAGRRRIILDLSEVNFVDSSGLGAIVLCLKQVGRNGAFVVAGAQGAVARLFKLTRLDKVIRLYPNVAAAAEHLAA